MTHVVEPSSLERVITRQSRRVARLAASVARSAELEAKAEAAAEGGTADLSDQVELAMTRLLYRQVVPGVIVGNLAAVFAVVYMWELTAPPLILGWMAALHAVNISRVYLGRAFHRAAPATLAEVLPWRRRATVMLAAVAAVVGVGVNIFIPELATNGDYAVATMVALTVAASFSISVPVKQAFDVFVWGMMASTGLALLLDGHLIMGGAMGVIGLLMTKMGDRFRAVLRDSVRLRFQNEALVAGLRDAKEAAEAADRAKTAFISNVSHELRTPLNAVLGFSSSLLEGGLGPAEREQVAMIEVSGRALHDLVEDVLDLARVERGDLLVQPGRVDLQKLLDEVILMSRDTARHQGLELAAILPHDAPRYRRVDARRLRQILLNLVGNALKFTDAGSVVVRVDGGASERLRISVSDTGAGIAPQDQGRIFRPFYQTSPEDRAAGGLGLGLAIVRQLVGALGGDLSLESVPRRGSTFRIELPAPLEEAAPAEPPLAERRITLVGPAGATREMVAAQLRRAGARVEERRPGQSLAAAGEAHLWIWDGDGGEIPSGASARAPMLLLTAAETETGLVAPGLGVVRKPIWRDQLLRMSASLIAGAAAPESPPLPALEGPMASPRVLVVDDNPINLRVARHLLDRLGCRVDVASSGEEAVACYAPDRFDLVLMDCQLPGMDGYDTTLALRGLEAGAGARTPVVAVTAGALPDEAGRCAEAGLDDLVGKPVTLEVIQRVLRRWAPRDVGSPEGATQK